MRRGFPAIFARHFPDHARRAAKRKSPYNREKSAHPAPHPRSYPPCIMADDGRVKRLKTCDTSVVELQRRNAVLESENRKLRLENAQLRGRLSEGDHAVLPVVVTTTVDLSRLDPSLVTQISSFLGTSRELFSLALTCKSFGWRQPTSTLNWSLVEEVSRQAVCSRATDDEMRCLPRYSSGSTTWLSIHHRLEHLLMFDVLLGAYIGYRNWDKTAVLGTKKGDFCTAVSSGHVMRSGIHFAEFEIISGEPYIGIVRPMPSLDAEAYENDCFFVGRRAFYHAFLAQRSDDWGDGNVHACEYSSYTGKVCWTDWDDGDDADWEGMECCGTGDTIGMLLNLEKGTLTVWKNNRRLGVMKDGLSGPYCRYTTVAGSESVAIQKAYLPISTTPK